jgi:hypothetical protein
VTELKFIDLRGPHLRNSLPTTLIVPGTRSDSRLKGTACQGSNFPLLLEQLMFLVVFFFSHVMGFELGASHLLGRCYYCLSHSSRPFL